MALFTWELWTDRVWNAVGTLSTRGQCTHAITSIGGRKWMPLTPIQIVQDDAQLIARSQSQCRQGLYKYFFSKIILLAQDKPKLHQAGHWILYVQCNVTPRRGGFLHREGRPSPKQRAGADFYGPPGFKQVIPHFAVLLFATELLKFPTLNKYYSMIHYRDSAAEFHHWPETYQTYSYLQLTHMPHHGRAKTILNTYIY